MANSRVADIISQTEGLLKLEGDDLGLSATGDLAVTFVNKLNAEFFDEFHAVGSLLPDYMKAEVGFDAVSNTALNGAILSGATSVIVNDSSDFETTSGAGVIREDQSFDVFEYSTNNTTTTFTGVTGVDFDHDDDASVQRLYKLPSRFDRPRPGFRRGHGVTVDSIAFVEVSENPRYDEFAIYDSGTNKYLWLPQGTTSGKIQVSYDKLPTTLSSEDSIIDVPLRYEDYLVYGLKAKWKETLIQGADVSFELAMKNAAIKKAFAKRSAGKTIRAGNFFFRKHGSPTRYHVSVDE